MGEVLQWASETRWLMVKHPKGDVFPDEMQWAHLSSALKNGILMYLTPLLRLPKVIGMGVHVTFDRWSTYYSALSYLKTTRANYKQGMQ